MSHKDNMDLRNTGDGGWFYAEHELFSVFAPLIGADGVAVYMAMCRLIPLAAVDPDRPVTMRVIEEASTVSRMQALRKKEQIVALGMVEETKSAARRPSTYKLVSLRQLALVGISELRRRLGVPGWDTNGQEQRSGAVLDGVQRNAQTASTRGEPSKPSYGKVSEGGRAPEASGKSGVPRRDTVASGGKHTLVDLVVSQKKASVSQKQAPVSQNRGSLFKEEKEEESPLSPPRGGTVSQIAAMSDVDEELHRVNEFRSRLKPPLPPLDRLEPSRAPTSGASVPQRRPRRRSRDPGS